MKIVALVSGGKDSCYNMMQCVAAGHDIVALANLAPYNKDELDSFMYQSVAHEGVALMGRAMGIPLYRQETKGTAHSINKEYIPTENDEVEDLFKLLQKIQADIQIEGVAVGAILSDYQRIRVENVCTRLGLISLAYLWQRDQAELLQEMIDCQIDAILVKVATLGLDPVKHLGKSIRQLQPHLLAMKEKYGLNVCGEGGEYETFTLDCPLYINKIAIDDSKMVIHSDNAIAPVGYLRLNKLHLVPKSIPTILKDRINDVSVRDSDGYITDSAEEAFEDGTTEEVKPEDVCDNGDCYLEPGMLNHPLSCLPTKSGWFWCGGIVGSGDDPEKGMLEALIKLESCLKENNMTVQNICAISLFVNDMSQYPLLNKAYCTVLHHINPPTRVCVQVPLPKNCHVILEALAWHQTGVVDADLPVDKQTLHVQGISHWAPANIGPYSQAIRVGNIICVAGQIGLVPGSMKLVSGGVKQQCQLTLRHIGRIVKAIGQNISLRDVVQGLCYVTKPQYIEQARCEWEERTNNAIVDYVVVSELPRGALIEWHVWAHKHNHLFEYEETGKCVEQYTISIRRRWNYENVVAAIVCHLSHTEGSVDCLSPEIFEEAVTYTLAKLNQNYEMNVSVDYLRIFYPLNRNIDIEMIYSVLTKLRELYNFVYTIVPVLSLQDNSIILSICGVRNE